MYVVDFGLCVIPLLATLTVFADHYMALTQTMLAMALLLLATTCTNFKYNSLKEVMNKTVDKTDRSYISWFVLGLIYYSIAGFGLEYVHC